MVLAEQAIANIIAAYAIVLFDRICQQGYFAIAISPPPSKDKTTFSGSAALPKQDGNNILWFKDEKLFANNVISNSGVKFF